MLGPGIVIIAGIITVWLAVVSNDGLVSDDYYKQGLAVNQRLHRDQKAGEMGLSADWLRSGRHVRLMIVARDGVQLPDTLNVKVMHPTQGGRDQVVVLKNQGAGFYAGELGNEIVGRWHVSVEDPGGQWRLQAEWDANTEEPLHLQGRMGH